MPHQDEELLLLLLLLVISRERIQKCSRRQKRRRRRRAVRKLFKQRAELIRKNAQNSDADSDAEYGKEVAVVSRCDSSAESEPDDPVHSSPEPTSTSSSDSIASSDSITSSQSSTSSQPSANKETAVVPKKIVLGKRRREPNPEDDVYQTVTNGLRKMNEQFERQKSMDAFGKYASSSLALFPKEKRLRCEKHLMDVLIGYNFDSQVAVTITDKE